MIHYHNGMVPEVNPVIFPGWEYSLNNGFYAAGYDRSGSWNSVPGPGRANI
jgi:hypothetical protein